MEELEENSIRFLFGMMELIPLAGVFESRINYAHHSRINPPFGANKSVQNIFFSLLLLPPLDTWNHLSLGVYHLDMEHDVVNMSATSHGQLNPNITSDPRYFHSI